MPGVLLSVCGPWKEAAGSSVTTDPSSLSTVRRIFALIQAAPESFVTMSLWALMLLLGNCYRQTSANLCSPTEYEKDGKCCSLCKPGQRLNTECAGNDDTECLSCEDGEYQDKWNRETSCLLHTVCNEYLGFEKISEGTAQRNVNCSCQQGKHCSSHSCDNCVLNTPCGPGEGVLLRANRWLDTQCAPCPEGTFSNVTSDTEPCVKWRSCTGSQEVHAGSAISDVVCGNLRTNSIWIYAVLVVIVLVLLSFLILLFVRKQRKVKKNPEVENIHYDKPVEIPVEIPQVIPEKENLLPAEEETETLNVPEEDQDFTIQGLPVAQEQGKDYHMSQEEK